jgi:hypothetical protein
MKKLLIAAVAASLCTSVLAAPAPKSIEVHEKTKQGGFYESVEQVPVSKTDAAAVQGNGAAMSTGKAAEVAKAQAGAIVPSTASPLSLSTPLVGSLTVGAAVGIGAAVVAAGVAIGNHGGGGGHHSNTSGTVAAR